MEASDVIFYVLVVFAILGITDALLTTIQTKRIRSLHITELDKEIQRLEAESSRWKKAFTRRIHLGRTNSNGDKLANGSAGERSQRV